MNKKTKNSNVQSSSKKCLKIGLSNCLGNHTSELKTCSDNSDSDDPFENIKSCNNITFSRSRSYLDEEFLLMPFTPTKPCAGGKENKLLVPNSKNGSLTEKKVKKRIGLSFKFNSSENVTKSRSCNTINVLSEVSNQNGCSPNLIEQTEQHDEVERYSKYQANRSQNMLSKTPSKSRFSDYSSATPTTPFEPNFNQNTSTPVTDRSSTPQASSFKGYSLMKAAVEAKKDYEDMLKAASLKKSIKKDKHKDAQSYGSPLTSLKDPTGQKDVLIFNHSLCVKSICNSHSKQYHQTLHTSNQSSNSCESPVNTSFGILDTTPVTEFSKTIRCCQSTLKKSSLIQRLSKSNEDVNKTPLCKKLVTSCTPLTGVQQLPKSTRKPISNPYYNSSISNDLCRNVEEDDDLPCTQPVSSIILKGVVAYVEVRSGKDCRSSGTKAELISLGAKVENNFTRKVTHCFFHGGKMSTYKKAIEWKVPLVSTLWIEACKEEVRMVPLAGYEPFGLDKYKEALPLYKLKTKVTRPLIKRAVTDSKLLSKPWKQNKEQDKAEKSAETNKPLLPASSEKDNIIDALHSVAGDFRKAAHQFQQILTSPILQKGNKKSMANDPTQKGKDGESIMGTKKRNKKLVFPEPTQDKCNQESLKSKNGSCDFSLVLNATDDTEQEIRVSYDSDDLLTYAKKQAANPRCSAPGRLLTSRKCKKLLSSCHKQTIASGQKNGETSTNNVPKSVQNTLVPSESSNSKKNTRQSTRNKNVDTVKVIETHNNLVDSKPKPKKRKLLVPLQVMTTFEQDSGESTPDLSPLCPYRESPNKKPKAGLMAKSQTVRAMPAPPVVSSSDAESEDSLTRAARRESSALFIKKQKKVISQRNLPTIVCTSLHRSDVEVVTSIVSRLGKFSVEGTVSEHTTHVVTSAPRRTINLLKGIARGCWVLNVQWVYESLEAGKWLHEERFELIQFSPSVKQARIERQAFGPEFSLELFRGVGPLYVCRATVPPAVDLIELLRLCGGSVVSSARAARIVVGNSSLLSPSGQRPPLVVSEKWILDTVTKLTQLSPYDYIASDSEP
uniref:BRCT domain-containing protein n=1 Tax=Graphocephala atropunctata TaxID=36148 RepID=A0A1B6L2I6_9HEMI